MFQAQNFLQNAFSTLFKTIVLLNNRLHRSCIHLPAVFMWSKVKLTDKEPK